MTLDKSNAPTPLLEAIGICKTFPGVRALHDARIVVHAGRLNAVLGENGAGKSTLMNILSGVFPPDVGEVRLDGKPVHFRTPREAADAGISIIHQELNLIPHLSVAENIFLGREPITRSGLIDRRAMNRASTQLLDHLGLTVDPRTPIYKLRVGAQQVVEIAKALSTDARVIIMDEPTSAISEHEVAALFRVIAELKRNGVGIIYITHKLDELPNIADDLTILRDGELITAALFESITSDEIVRLMVGRDLADLFPKSNAVPGKEVLRVTNLSLADQQRPCRFLVQSVSFNVRCCEVLGIFGLMGAGRTELLQALFGLHPQATTGTVLVDGHEMRIDSPAAAISAGLALAPEDRKQEGLVLPLSVAENVSMSSHGKTEKWGFLSNAKEHALAGKYASRLLLKTPSLRQPVRNLSGGNQQKVVLSKWLATEPKVLLLDEPTRGIDINSKREIYTLIDELAGSGLGVVMVSSELPEILAIADRIVVLCEGRKTAEFSRQEATEERILKAALPTGKAVA
jgi:ABC-type sugar transport system ATPase subunit